MARTARWPHALTVLSMLVASPALASAAAPLRPYTIVLGTAQDGGVPQAGCTKACCAHGRHELVSSLALVDPATRRWWLFDATPDMGAQLTMMRREAPACSLAGVFVTHAHIGHYTGLMQFGREAMGTHDVPVWAMARMREIPHPFIVESLERFARLPAAARARVRFIHLNHTNRAALRGSEELKRIETAGSHVAVSGERVEL